MHRRRWFGFFSEQRHEIGSCPGSVTALNLAEVARPVERRETAFSPTRRKRLLDRGRSYNRYMSLFTTTTQDPMPLPPQAPVLLACSPLPLRPHPAAPGPPAPA